MLIVITVIIIISIIIIIIGIVIIVIIFIIPLQGRLYRDLPVCTYIRTFVHTQTVSLLYRLHFLTDCHETSHTCSQTSSFV